MRESCVLLFSGGRDSTLASLRLADCGKSLILATVRSEHLVGISLVKERLVELKPHLPEDTICLMLSDLGFTIPPLAKFPNTCLDCFLNYATIGAVLARQFNTKSIAFGFTKYQSSWPEQTPYAVSRLREVLNDFNFDLDLPAHDIETEKKAIEKLKKLKLNSDALEQKCLRKISNKDIPEAMLMNAIDEFSIALRASISSTILAHSTSFQTKKLGNIF